MGAVACHAVHGAHRLATSAASAERAQPLELAAASLPLRRPSLAGEYEPVGDLVLSWDPGLEQFLFDVIGAAWGEASITLLYAPGSDAQSLGELLRASGRDPDELQWIEVPLESIWVRDFGPILLRNAGVWEALDFDYFAGGDDDRVPEVLSQRAHPPWRLERVELELEGGNLLSDGTGRCITTVDTIAHNAGVYSEDEVKQILADRAGCEALSVLPRLLGEPTGHVDMFVTVTGPGEVIVGKSTMAEDPENAALLDLAARTLQSDGFSVRRVPMPGRSDGVFRSYTNSLAVNNVVLVPIYPEEPQHLEDALSVFQEAYPGRSIVPINASDIIQLDGAVHCASMTIAR
jgi:agmatine deiminase